MGAYLGIAATGVGSLVRGFGANAAGNASANNYNFQSEVAAYNAMLDQQKAQMASLAGEVRASRRGDESQGWNWIGEGWFRRKRD
jgi:hypothetical protein